MELRPVGVAASAFNSGEPGEESVAHDHVTDERLTLRVRAKADAPPVGQTAEPL